MSSHSELTELCADGPYRPTLSYLRQRQWWAVSCPLKEQKMQGRAAAAVAVAEDAEVEREPEGGGMG